MGLALGRETVPAPFWAYLLTVMRPQGHVISVFTLHVEMLGSMTGAQGTSTSLGAGRRRSSLMQRWKTDVE